MASDLRRTIVEWSVSLPTCWGVLVQWGGIYLGVTIENTPICPVPHVSWITLSLTGCVLLASENTMVRHGATPQQVRRFLVAVEEHVAFLPSNLWARGELTLRGLALANAFTLMSSGDVSCAGCMFVLCPHLHPGYTETP